MWLAQANMVKCSCSNDSVFIIQASAYLKQGKYKAAETLYKQVLPTDDFLLLDKVSIA